MTNVDLVRLAERRGRLAPEPSVDPVTAEVIRNSMETVCFEMAQYVSRTATTPPGVTTRRRMSRATSAS